MRKRLNGGDGDPRASISFPARWVDLGGPGPRSSADDDLERRVGQLLEKVPPPPALGRSAHGRIEARLRDPRVRRATTTSWIPRLAMGSGLGMFSLLLGGAVIAAGGVGAWWRVTQTRAVSPAVDLVAGLEGGGSVRRPARPRAMARLEGAERFREVTPAPVAEPAPVPEARPPEAPSDVAPAAAARPPASPRPRALVPSPSIAPRASVSEPGPTELAQETRLLRVALAELRQRHDGAAALTTLNDYLGRFPNGTLLGEARRARIDALLLLGRRDEALSALDRLDLEPVGRGQELLLIRGELRARRDCADAIADFDVVVDHAPPPRFAERALFGRAVCRQHEGQRGAARADALAYLERFPGGRFADSARRLVVTGAIPPTGRTLSPGDP